MKPARAGTPRRAKPVHIPAKRTPFFKVGKELKEMVDGDEAAVSSDESDGDEIGETRILSMKLLKRLLYLAIFLAAVYAAIEFRDRNLDPMVVHLLVWQTPAIPVWVVVVVAFLGGALAASVLLLVRIARSNLTARRYRRAANKLESEVHQLRNLPLAAEQGAGTDGSA